jgi:hypothetical protein
LVIFPLLVPGKEPGGAEERPWWNKPLWSEKARQTKVSLSSCGEKKKVKVRNVSKSPVQKSDLSAKRSKRKSNDVEKPLLDGNNSFADKKVSGVDGNSEFKLLESALEAADGTTFPTLAAETPLDTGSTKPGKQTPLETGVSKSEKNGIEIELTAADELPTPMKKQRRLKSPDLPNRYESQSTSLQQHEIRSLTPRSPLKR